MSKKVLHKAHKSSTDDGKEPTRKDITPLHERGGHATTVVQANCSSPQRNVPAGAQSYTMLVEEPQRRHGKSPPCRQRWERTTAHSPGNSHELFPSSAEKTSRVITSERKEPPKARQRHEALQLPISVVEAKRCTENSPPGVIDTTRVKKKNP